MYTLIAVICVLTVVSAAPQAVNWFEIQPAKVEHASNLKLQVKASTRLGPYHETWKEFKTLFGKVYDTVEEEIKRFDIFRDTLERIEEHNRKYHMGQKSYYMGVNQFSDMSHDEYLRHNGLRRGNRKYSKGEGCDSYTKSGKQLDDKVDWRDKGYVTPVKNQGQCGSCWSFSTTGSLEGQHFRQTGKLISLSEQQLVDCSGTFGNEGCNGGLMDNAFEYIKSIGGLEGEDDYPYTAKQGKCHLKKSLFKANDTGCTDVESGDEDALKDALASVGPISVAIDASHASFQSYDGGVYDEEECSSQNLDHGVLTVGYGTEENGGDYWLVKNSWGEMWGEEGYIKMSRNKDNQCGIATQASYPNVQL
uniref:Cathepsin L n=1 Tax=Pinctada fucata TaxID=50426 RepID=D1G103_PINFU|nr:cathepsin L [Pinctada fucata]